jgi:hypothetical protein
MQLTETLLSNKHLKRIDKVSDVDKLASILEKRFSGVSLRTDYGWPCPPLNVIDCVLSLNRRYNSFVLPRINSFAKNHSAIVELKQLNELMKRHKSLVDFSRVELNYNDASRAQVLWGVVEYMRNVQHNYKGANENERLQQWAISVRPEDAFSVGVKGFGLSGFQYMRMLFGAQTTKPDTHIQSFVSEVLGRAVSDWNALSLLERAAKRTALPLREVDNSIWQERARK